MRNLLKTRIRVFFIAFLFIGFFIANGNGKGTWFTNMQWGVINTNATANDYAAINQGQLKWIAAQAYTAMTENLDNGNDVPTGDFPSAAQLVATFSNENNFAAANLGQVKYVATPFYNWLINEGVTNDYPWADAAVTNDFGVANIGQVKQTFNFSL